MDNIEFISINGKLYPLNCYKKAYIWHPTTGFGAYVHTFYDSKKNTTITSDVLGEISVDDFAPFTASSDLCGGTVRVGLTGTFGLTGFGPRDPSPNSSRNLVTARNISNKNQNLEVRVGIVDAIIKNDSYSYGIGTEEQESFDSSDYIKNIKINNSVYNTITNSYYSPTYYWKKGTGSTTTTFTTEKGGYVDISFTKNNAGDIAGGVVSIHTSHDTALGIQGWETITDTSTTTVVRVYFVNINKNNSMRGVSVDVVYVFYSKKLCTDAGIRYINLNNTVYHLKNDKCDNVGYWNNSLYTKTSSGTLSVTANNRIRIDICDSPLDGTVTVGGIRTLSNDGYKAGTNKESSSVLSGFNVFNDNKISAWYTTRRNGDALLKIKVQLTLLKWY